MYCHLFYGLQCIHLETCVNHLSTLTFQQSGNVSMALRTTQWCHKSRRFHVRDKRFGVAWSSSGDTEFVRPSHYVAPTGYFAKRFGPALLYSGFTSLAHAFRARVVFYSIFDDNDGKFRCFILSFPWTCRLLEPITDQSFNTMTSCLCNTSRARYVKVSYTTD